MDVQVVAAITGVAALVMGATAVLASRHGGRTEPAPQPSHPSAALPPGISALLSVLPSVAIVVDRVDVVVRSSSAARSFGLVQGDRLVVDELLRLVHEVRRDERIRDREIDVRRARGRFDYETYCFSVRVAPLGLDFVMITAEDQTELRRVEAVRRDFVANVSHELKTPAGALSLLAETIEGAADDPESVRRFTGRMQHESYRLNTLVQELITLSRIQGGDPIPEPEAVSLDKVVAEATDRCRLAANAKNISLVAREGAGLLVWGDEDLLVTALRNLIDNAISYSSEHTRVVVSVRRDGDTAEIGVADQGIGIDERDQERIFERFYRVDPARSRATGGTGLGLSIVKHVTTNHGGEVRVWSKKGIGSTFTLRLPMYEVEDPSSEACEEDHRRSLREARS